MEINIENPIAGRSLSWGATLPLSAEEKGKLGNGGLGGFLGELSMLLLNMSKVRPFDG